MQVIEHTDEKGRKYKAMQDGEMILVLGPPEGLVDDFGLPEPFATNLHNILFRRGLFTYKDAARNMNSLYGALQEAYRLDVQRLTEIFVTYSQEVQNE